MMNYNDFVLNLLQNKSLSLIGFADLKDIDSDMRNGLRYGICIAIALNVFPSLTDTPTLDYYNEYKDVNTKLKEASYLLEEKIQEQGFTAYSLARNKQNDDFRTILPFKTLATRAGLGWIGKSSLFITKEYGSAVRLNGVITNMPFETAKPVDSSLCGDCRKCVDRCPANAILGNSWDLNKDRNDLVNPFLCKSKVIERGKPFDITVGSCGICIAACPWSQKYRKTIC